MKHSLVNDSHKAKFQEKKVKNKYSTKQHCLEELTSVG
jgi:hypothetical protein